MESGCDDNDPECICPCRCGCQNGEGGNDLPFSDGVVDVPVGQIGICRSCFEGRHEIPPGNQTPPLATLIELTRSYLDQLERVRPQRENEGE